MLLFGVSEFFFFDLLFQHFLVLIDFFLLVLVVDSWVQCLVFAFYIVNWLFLISKGMMLLKIWLFSHIFWDVIVGFMFLVFGAHLSCHRWRPAIFVSGSCRRFLSSGISVHQFVIMILFIGQHQVHLGKHITNGVAASTCRLLHRRALLLRLRTEVGRISSSVLLIAFGSIGHL